MKWNMALSFRYIRIHKSSVFFVYCRKEGEGFSISVLKPWKIYARPMLVNHSKFSEVVVEVVIVSFKKNKEKSLERKRGSVF